MGAVNQLVETALDKVVESFEQFCLTAGVASLVQMFGKDADTLAGG